ncbi:MAG: GNAT family N-acetyltransferase [Xanthobacteraceae bacterium]
MAVGNSGFSVCFRVGHERTSDLSGTGSATGVIRASPIKWSFRLRNVGAGMTVAYRNAVKNDEAGILAVLVEVAPEIVAPASTSEERGRLEHMVTVCRMSGKSWVAVDDGGNIVGFALARFDFDELEALRLHFIGVSKKSRKQKIFSSLIEKLKTYGVSVNARVLHTNKSKMTENLPKVGFTNEGSNASETKFRWDPPNATQADKA